MEKKMIDFENLALPPELANRHFLTPKEFGSLLGVTDTAIYNWGRRGLIKITRMTPRNCLISVAELERIKRGEMMEPREPEKK